MGIEQQIFVIHTLQASICNRCTQLSGSRLERFCVAAAGGRAGPLNSRFGNSLRNGSVLSAHPAQSGMAGFQCVPDRMSTTPAPSRVCQDVWRGIAKPGPLFLSFGAATELPWLTGRGAAGSQRSHSVCACVLGGLPQRRPTGVERPSCSGVPPASSTGRRGAGRPPLRSSTSARCAVLRCWREEWTRQKEERALPSYIFNKSHLGRALMGTISLSCHLTDMEIVWIHVRFTVALATPLKCLDVCRASRLFGGCTSKKHFHFLVFLPTSLVS